MKFKTVAKAVFVLENDETGEIGQATVIKMDSRLYLVASWLQALGATERTPEWLVPLDGLAGQGQEDQELISLQRKLPRELLTSACPLSVRQRFGAVLNPALAHIPGPSSIQ